MDVILSTGSLTGMPLSDIFRAARRAGADGVELMLSSRLVAQSPVRFLELERSTQVPVRSVHTILRLARVSPQQAAQDIVDSARFARNFARCASLVVHTPIVTGMHTEDTRRWLDAIEAATAITDHLPIRIAVENGGRLAAKEPTSFFDHPDRLRWLAEEWSVGVTFDTSHAASRGWDLLATAERLRPHLVNLHLSDFGRRSYSLGLANALLRDHQVPGTGTLPLGDLLQSLSGSGYDGLVTLELSPLAVRSPLTPAVDRKLRQAIDFCRMADLAGRPSAEGARHQNRPRHG